MIFSPCLALRTPENAGVTYFCSLVGPREGRGHEQLLMKKYAEDLQVVKVTPPLVLCKRLWDKNNCPERQKRSALFHWLPLALVMMHVWVLYKTGLLTAACSNLQKPRSTSNGIVGWLPLEWRVSWNICSGKHVVVWV